MIDPKCLSAAWLDQKSKELQYPYKENIEMVIRAFSFMDMLAKNGCPCELRGGLGLMLYFQDDFKRLSTDIDISCPFGTDIEKYFVQYHEYGFTSFEAIWTECEVVCEGFHVKHFAFHFDSLCGGEEPLVVDVALIDNAYEENHRVELAHSLIETIGDKPVLKLVSLGDILAEKLFTAVRRYRIPEKMFKQMYDIGKIFDQLRTTDIVKLTLPKVFTIHNDNIPYTQEEYDGAFNVMRLLAYNLTVGESMEFLTQEDLQDGLDGANSYVYKRVYSYDDFVKDLSKFAYVATCIQYDIQVVEHYDGNSDSLADLIIGDVLPSDLNLLKSTNPEAFYYWYKVEELFK